MATDKPKCLASDCHRTSRQRGLCLACYQAAAKIVNSGEMTWEKLETLGLARKRAKRLTNAFLLALQKAKQSQGEPPCPPSQ